MNTGKNLGQSIVEFAIVIPLFLLIVLFILDMGRVVFIYSGMTNAVREGARLGSVNCNSSAIYDRVTEMSEFPFAIMIDCFSQDADGLNVVFVSGSHSFQAATPFIENLFENNEINIYTESTMHREFTGQQ